MTKASIDRRGFLKAGAALAATSGLSLNTIAQNKMIERMIPGTNEGIPVIGLGGSTVFNEVPPEGKQLSYDLLRAMVEHGGRFKDTSPFFRPNPPVIGELLADLNLTDELFLTSKITVDGKEAGLQHIETAMANLNKQPMDLLMVHNMRDMHFHWPTLKDLKEAGRTRYIGVSFARPNQSAYNNYANFDSLESFMRLENPDFVMIPYSIHNPEIEERILPLAADMGTAVVIIEAFKTTDDGGLFGLVAGKELPEWAADYGIDTWAKYSLKWIVGHPAVTTVITETSKVKHVIDNMGAGYGELPDQAMRKRMSDYLLALS